MCKVRRPRRDKFFNRGFVLSNDDLLFQTEAINHFGVRLNRFASQNEQSGPVARPHGRESLQKKIDSFPGSHVRHMQDQKFVPHTEISAHFLSTAAGRSRGKEIRNDLDIARNLQNLPRLFPQAFGNGRDRIRSGERIFDRGAIGRILA